MIIWVCDYNRMEVTRIGVLPKTEDEILNVYNDNIEDWLKDHEEELGLCMRDAQYFMAPSEKNYKEICF